jgi:hypothetical protein
MSQPFRGLPIKTMPILSQTSTRVDVGPIIWICKGKNDLLANSRDANTKRNQYADLVSGATMTSTWCWRKMLLERSYKCVVGLDQLQRVR